MINVHVHYQGISDPPPDTKIKKLAAKEFESFKCFENQGLMADMRPVDGPTYLGFYYYPDRDSFLIAFEIFPQDTHPAYSVGDCRVFVSRQDRGLMGAEFTDCSKPGGSWSSDLRRCWTQHAEKLNGLVAQAKSEGRVLEEYRLKSWYTIESRKFRLLNSILDFFAEKFGRLLETCPVEEPLWQLPGLRKPESDIQDSPGRLREPDGERERSTVIGETAIGHRDSLNFYERMRTNPVQTIKRLSRVGMVLSLFSLLVSKLVAFHIANPLIAILAFVAFGGYYLMAHATGRGWTWRRN